MFCQLWSDMFCAPPTYRPRVENIRDDSRNCGKGVKIQNRKSDGFFNPMCTTDLTDFGTCVKHVFEAILPPPLYWDECAAPASPHWLHGKADPTRHRNAGGQTRTRCVSRGGSSPTLHRVEIYIISVGKKYEQILILSVFLSL